MKIIKKVIKITGIALFFIVAGLSLVLYTSGPTLPNGTDKIIDTVLVSPLPELILGKTGFAKSQGLNIWYESISPKGPSKGLYCL